MRLKATFTPSFSRDLKRVRRRGLDEGELAEVIDLIIENTPESREVLTRRHRMHSLKGAWKGSSECHVANAGDWLVIWREADGVAFLQRTGTHDEVFRYPGGGNFGKW